MRGQIADLPDGVAAHVAGVVGEHIGLAAAATVEATVGMARRVRRELGTGPGVFGLIHADLHQETYLVERGRVGAIDFDHCGWGHYLHDLTVTLSELRWRPDYDARRAELLRGYRAVRPLPEEHERLIEVFHGRPLLHVMLWFLEQRDHPGSAD